MVAAHRDIRNDHADTRKYR